MIFENLTPDTILSTVEQAAGVKLTGLINPLPSYINRVYELRAHDGTKLIVKFYRQGRWSRDAILDEHRFILDCNEAEIPVVPPVSLSDGTTLGENDSIFFALFPKKAGRQLEINDDSDWLRLGSLIGRLHNTGALRIASSRITINPLKSAIDDIHYLCAGIVPERFREQYRSTAMKIIDTGAELFEGPDTIRIHGDCHRGNILDRIEEGLLIIDFDDMAMGPPVQDLWLLLPDRHDKSRREIDLFLEGYERFRAFDRRSLRCIETLRAMRMIYFLSWVSRQVDDYRFRTLFPAWGNDAFWQQEINDLREQAGFVMDDAERES